jgi:hypothetical protein
MVRMGLTNAFLRGCYTSVIKGKKETATYNRFLRCS